MKKINVVLLTIIILISIVLLVEFSIYVFIAKKGALVSQQSSSQSSVFLIDNQKPENDKRYLALIAHLNLLAKQPGVTSVLVTNINGYIDEVKKYEGPLKYDYQLSIKKEKEKKPFSLFLLRKNEVDVVQEQTGRKDVFENLKKDMKILIEETYNLAHQSYTYKIRFSQ